MIHDLVWDDFAFKRLKHGHCVRKMCILSCGQTKAKKAGLVGLRGKLVKLGGDEVHVALNGICTERNILSAQEVPRSGQISAKYEFMLRTAIELSDECENGLKDVRAGSRVDKVYFANHCAQETQLQRRVLCW